MKDEILKILTESELFNINNDIKDFNRISISVQKNRDPLPSYINIDISILTNELIEQIYKDVIGYIKKESIVEYYDFLKKDIEGFSESNTFTNLVYSILQKKIITNGRFSNIIAEIGSSLYYNGLNRSNTGNVINSNNSRLPYKIIENYNSIIFNDPFLKYNDNSLIVFDDILINISNLDILDDEYKISINCLVGFGVKNPKIYSVIESEKSEGYVDFIKRVRRGRIKGIVEE